MNYQSKTNNSFRDNEAGEGSISSNHQRTKTKFSNGLWRGRNGGTQGTKGNTWVVFEKSFLFSKSTQKYTSGSREKSCSPITKEMCRVASFCVCYHTIHGFPECKDIPQCLATATLKATCHLTVIENRGKDEQQAEFIMKLCSLFTSSSVCYIMLLW